MAWPASGKELAEVHPAAIDGTDGTDATDATDGTDATDATDATLARSYSSTSASASMTSAGCTAAALAESRFCESWTRKSSICG